MPTGPVRLFCAFARWRRTHPLKRSLLDLRHVVTDVLALARYESALRRITIRTDLPNDLPAVSGIVFNSSRCCSTS